MGNTQTSQRLAIKNINIKIPISSPHNVGRHPGGWAVAVVPAGGDVENLIQIRTFISTNNHHLGFLDTTAHQRAVSIPNLEKINCAISQRRGGASVSLRAGVKMTQDPALGSIIYIGQTCSPPAVVTS